MKSYKKPVLNVERFTANEFVAACGESGVTINLNVMQVVVYLEMFMLKVMV